MLKPECATIQDLLPLYVEDACSEETHQLVAEHLATCPDCIEALRKMKKALPAETPSIPSESAEFKATVTHLNKKMRWKRVFQVLFGMVLAFALVCVGLYLRNYYFIEPEKVVPIAYQSISNLRVDENGEVFYTYGTLAKGNYLSSSSYFDESTGVLFINYGMPRLGGVAEELRTYEGTHLDSVLYVDGKLYMRKSYQDLWFNDFTEVISLGQEVREVRLGDWKDSIVILSPGDELPLVNHDAREGFLWWDSHAKREYDFSNKTQEEGQE